ncbi:MAG: class II aldolase/adducin family protein [Actinomycetia bacterium]|nr:class II aldolase/adducin family protein [Actinomycetes bacterium]
MPEYGFEQFKRDLLDGVSAAASGVSTAAREAADAAKGAADSVMRIKDFREVGRDLFVSGAVTSHGGNLSVSDGSRIWITRTAAQLAHIHPSDVVQVPWQASDADVAAAASMELKVHRAMYHALTERLTKQGEDFGVRAVLHSHSLYTVFQSLSRDALTPLDSEGKLVLGAAVPVLSPQQTVAADEVATMMAELVSGGGSLAVIRGHGPFAMADSLQNALRLVSCLEYSAHILTLREQAGGRVQ